jgi:predicted translin family RNA/ssDNA-binding protein
MRKAIGAINAGEVEDAHSIRGFIQAIYEGAHTYPFARSFPSLARHCRDDRALMVSLLTVQLLLLYSCAGFQQLTTDKKNDLRQKIAVMEASVKKVEGACLALCIQGVEKLALLGTSSDD